MNTFSYSRTKDLHPVIVHLKGFKQFQVLIGMIKLRSFQVAVYITLLIAKPYDVSNLTN